MTKARPNFLLGRAFRQTGELGFEPRLTDPESRKTCFSTSSSTACQPLPGIDKFLLFQGLRQHRGTGMIAIPGQPETRIDTFVVTLLVTLSGEPCGRAWRCLDESGRQSG